MRITPDLTEFTELARTRRVISVHTRLTGDHLTAVGLYATLCGAREGTFLLESASEGVWSRWSFVGVRTAATLTEQNGRAVWLGRELAGIGDGDPLEVLRTTLTELATPATEGLPPFHAGMVGYLGYDVVRRLERLPDTCVDDLQLPELVMMLASQLAVLDHHTGEVILIANAINYDDTDEGVERAWSDAVAGIEEMARRLAEPMPSLAAPLQEGLADLPVRRQRSSAEYQDAVRATIGEIEAGEAFQVVVSQRFDIETGSDALEVYRALRLTNPSPYLYLLRLPGFAVVGSSPEALVTVKEGIATTRPIAGSRPRGHTEAEDRRLAEELLADPKERAEHLMLVDLGRNDLGRICRPGSVTVHEFMQIHRYSHIMHLEAAVSGELASGHTALDATLACFPAGTLSGAPKVRAMEIIDELEVSRRGLYGGVVGYFDFAGNSDVAIAIRTAVLRDGVAHVQAGAGIVADSRPELEDAECSHKAAAVITALRRAARMEEAG
ncbi:anthranilate synthase component I [Arachnia propionica]|uniref:Anthranilate synthase component 1 n=1 Tax=Arachnia propionica TaxID=1750 RepID=A0A3P1TCR4_9ACTN|nr:anthranilate synthase component I [Arachnia propionica]RRD07242.1 anthranilate synthase component I [Arachnia propionica]